PGIHHRHGPSRRFRHHLRGPERAGHEAGDSPVSGASVTGAADATGAAGVTAATGVQPGHLYGVGLGPGDPGLITRRGAEIILGADVVAFHAGTHGRSTARRIASDLLTERADAGRPAIEELLVYPVTVGG